MNRREFLKATGAAAVASGIGGTGVDFARAAAMPATTPATIPAAFGLASAPVLLNPSQQSVDVVCAVNSPASGWVDYGPTESLGSRAVGGAGGLLPFSERVLNFRITGLKPGEKCFYRVNACAIDFAGPYSIHRGAQVQSEMRVFRTLDPSAASASFTVWNDTHENNVTIKALADSLAKSPTDFLFWNGDICNDIGDEDKVIDQFINPAGLAYADSTPVMFSRGNHDVRGRFARRLPQYVNGPGDRYYYQFRQGPVAVLVMDTGEDKPDNAGDYAGLNDFDSYRTEQQKWLASAIENPQFQTAPFRIAFLHIPLLWEETVPESWSRMYGKVRGWVCDDGMAKWHDLLVRGRIDLVISGHTHRHAWFPPNENRPYGQLIGGGPKPEAATCIICSADANRFEFVMLNLQGKELLRHQIPAARG